MKGSMLDPSFLQFCWCRKVIVLAVDRRIEHSGTLCVTPEGFKRGTDRETRTWSTEALRPPLARWQAQ